VLALLEASVVVRGGADGGVAHVVLDFLGVRVRPPGGGSGNAAVQEPLPYTAVDAVYEGGVMDAKLPGGPARELANGVRMPMLGLGVWQVAAGRLTEQAVSWALEAGYRHVDTAAAYGNETSVGAALRRSGVPREELFVTTKLVPSRHDALREFDESLARLGLDYVDLYLIHWPAGDATARHWRALETLYGRGSARAIGVSNFGVGDLARLAESATMAPLVNQVQLSPFHYRRRLVEYCEGRGVVFEGYSPLERGRGTNDRTVKQIAARSGRTTAQILLRWSVQHDVIVIPKSTHQDRIRENAQIFDFELSDADMRALDALDQTGGTADP
jgi:diketogulonate reductase-like aldo/keto reductase